MHTTGTPKFADLVADLQSRLDARSDAATRAWWTEYLKGRATFRGVKMAGIREALRDWVAAHDLGGALSPAYRVRLATRLVRERPTEDKLAGTLWLGEHLVGERAVRWRRDLPRFAALFDRGHLADWNAVDWFCVKVLGPLAAKEGEPCARAIAGWCRADDLWRRRASGVAFVNLAERGDEFFEGFIDLVLETCAYTVRDPHRFAQTGTGWVLRELGEAAPERVARFLEGHLHELSAEGLRYATERWPPDRKRVLRSRHRASR